MHDSFLVAGTCVAKGFRSGAKGIFEQPSIYASRHGTAGLVKGVGKAFVGAIVKPGEKFMFRLMLFLLLIFPASNKL